MHPTARDATCPVWIVVQCGEGCAHQRNGTDAVIMVLRAHPGPRGFLAGKTHSYAQAAQREHTSSSGRLNVHFICARRSTKHSMK